MPAWWPDWRGCDAAIIASGPSAKHAELGALRGRAKVLAIKQNVELFPDADAVYGCDASWWKHRRGLPEYRGLKVTFAGNKLIDFPDVRRVEIRKIGKQYVDAILMDRPGEIGAGGNSGFQAINLAVQFGAIRILLIGFDMHGQSGVHWYGRNHWPQANNPDDRNFQRWIAAFDAVAPRLEGMGVEVINASANSALKCFPKRSITETLRDWAA